MKHWRKENKNIINNNITNKYNMKYYIYAIYFENKIVYIGSTVEFKNREKSHNRELNKVKDIYKKIDNSLCDKYIKYCINKGCNLKNLVWSTYFDENLKERSLYNYNKLINNPPFLDKEL